MDPGYQSKISRYSSRERPMLSQSTMSEQHVQYESKRFETPRKHVVPATPPHYRTNFTSKGYVPPSTQKWSHRNPLSLEDAESVPFDQIMDQETHRRRIASDVESRPFDESMDQEGFQVSPIKGISHYVAASPVGRQYMVDYIESSPSASSPSKSSPSKSSQSKSSPSKSSPSKSPPSHRVFYSEQEDKAVGRYRMAPPRITEPITSFSNEDNYEEVDISMRARIGPPWQKVSDVVSYEEFDVAPNTSLTNSSATGPQAKGADRRRIARLSAETDEDSLFDFEEVKRRRNNGSITPPPTKTQQALKLDTDVDLLAAQGFSCCTPAISPERQTNPAWKRPSPEKSPTLPKPSVSFGKDDTIHHFEPDPDDTVDNSTLAGRSLDSEYTKSAESEVEDLLKDLLLIGNGVGNQPGRRKIKHNPVVREQLRREREMVDDDTFDGTIETFETDEDRNEPRIREVPHKQQSPPAPVPVEEKKEDDNPILDMWGMMEGGLNAVSAALGIDGQACSERKIMQCNREEPTPEKPSKSGLQELIEYASGIIMGPTSPKVEENQQPVDPEPVEREMKQPDIIVSAPSLEDDDRLVALAMQAARSKHKLKGYEFDESYDIDIGSDIMFSVVDLGMPLGLIFQESETGCWVTKLLPDGSAMRSQSVEVGDQLAAINGVSAIGLKVDEIAALIKTNGHLFELTFLRYIGPLKPLDVNVKEEGYEISASNRNLKPPPSSPPRKLQNTPILKRPSPEKQEATSLRILKPAVQESVPEKGDKKRFRLFGCRKQNNA